VNYFILLQYISLFSNYYFWVIKSQALKVLWWLLFYVLYFREVLRCDYRLMQKGVPFLVSRKGVQRSPLQAFQNWFFVLSHDNDNNILLLGKKVAFWPLFISFLFWDNDMERPEFNVGVGLLLSPWIFVSLVFNLIARHELVLFESTFLFKAVSQGFYYYWCKRNFHYSKNKLRV